MAAQINAFIGVIWSGFSSGTCAPRWKFLFISYGFPLTNTSALIIELGKGEEEEVSVTATRSSRTIANIAIRTEMISGKELAQKSEKEKLLKRRMND